MKSQMKTQMKTTNITVNMELITPEKAENYLRFNTRNRPMKQSNVRFLSNQIKQGLFVENGESIVFDSQGRLRNGQHRLKAISLNNKSFLIPVVKGVEPDCMATYDTGKNRSAADVLKLNGFQYNTNIASFVKAINIRAIKKSKRIELTTSKEETLTNQQILNYVELNYDWLLDIVTKVETIYKKMNISIIAKTQIYLIVYLIGGQNPSDDVYNFIKHLTGVIKVESSAPLYLHNKLYNAKVNKEPLNRYWVLGMALKAWNFYCDGNPAVRHFKFSVEQELPKVNY